MPMNEPPVVGLPPLTVGQLDKQIQISWWPYIVQRVGGTNSLAFVILETIYQVPDNRRPRDIPNNSCPRQCPQIHSWENLNYQSLTQLQSL